MTKIKMIGLLDIKGMDNARRVYDPSGIAPTLTTSQGGNRQPKILVGGGEVSEIKVIGHLDAPGWYDKQKRVYDTSGVSPTVQAAAGTAGNQQTKVLLNGGEGLKTLKTNDLFCGAGGVGIAFQQAGFEIAGAWDFDKYAVQSYKHNVGDHVQQADISQMTFEDMPKADVWTFGFPCQDLSVAGKQAGLFEGKRSGLFFEVMRLLDETIENDINNLPSIIMAENVKGLKPYLEVLEQEYKQRGYKMYYTLYNSKYWGVPQNRERYFVVGIHESIDKEFVFPIQQEYYIPRLSTVLESEVDEKYYISDEKAAKVIEEAAQKIELKDTHACLTPDRPKRQNGPRAKADELESHTLTAQDRHGVIENMRVRKLLPIEYKRLQGFPEGYEIVVSDSQAYKQFGNAVSVPVVKAIAERMRMFLLSL